MNRFGRRSALSGLLGGLAGTGVLPLIDAQPRRARAQAGALPKRLLFFYTPNGTQWSEFARADAAGALTFGRILAPLEPHKAKVNVLYGVHMEMAAAGGIGSHHARGIAGLLTGQGLNVGNFVTAGGSNGGWGKGISLDQELANRLGSATKFKSLELGVMVTDNEVRGRLSYSGANQPVTPVDDPYAVFDRVFSGLQPHMGDVTMERVRLERKSVLDYLLAETGAVRGRLGVRDRDKIDMHVSSLREIERRLAMTPTAAECTAPMLGARLDPHATANMPTIGKLQMDLAASALACDLTRIITLQWTWAESNQTFPWLGLPTFAHHSQSHQGDADAVALEGLTKINTWYGEQFAYLLRALDSYPEGNGTLLDNTIVVWANEIAHGNNHAHRDIPFVIAGKGGGAIRTGRFIDYLAMDGIGRQHNDLLITLAGLMGVNLTAFGDPAWTTGPLPGLV